MSDGNRYGAGRRSKAFQLRVERVDGGLVGVVELAGEPGIDSRLQEEKEPLPLLRALFPAHALQVTGSKLTAGSLLLLPFLVAISIVQCSLYFEEIGKVREGIVPRLHKRPGYARFNSCLSI